MRPIKQAIELVRSINTNNTMSDYMKKDQTAEPADPFDESNLDLRKTRRVENLNVERLQIVRENVEKIHRAAQSGAIPADEQVEQALRPVSSAQGHEACYYFTCGPVAAEVSGLEWRTAYRLDLDDAVEVGSDEFRAVASEFDIPDGTHRKLVPDFISQAYRHLVRLTEYNDGTRAVHPWELSYTGKTPFLDEPNYDYAMEYIDQLPGVIPPQRDGNAWEYETEADADATKTGESHA